MAPNLIALPCAVATSNRLIAELKMSACNLFIHSCACGGYHYYFYYKKKAVTFIFLQQLSMIYKKGMNQIHTGTFQFPNARQLSLSATELTSFTPRISNLKTFLLTMSHCPYLRYQHLSQSEQQYRRKLH